MRLTENRTKIQFWHCWKSSVLFLYHLFRCRRCDIFQPANVHWRHRATSSDRNDHTHTHTLVILKRALQTKAKNSCWSNVQYENDNVALFIFLPGHLNLEHRETTTPTVSVERPFHLKCMSWDCARKPMQAQGDHANSTRKGPPAVRWHPHHRAAAHQSF